jgi:hypothetical protein
MDVQRRALLKGMTATAAISMVGNQAALGQTFENVVVGLRQTSASILNNKPVTGVISQHLRHTAFAKGLLLGQPHESISLHHADLAEINQLLTQKKTHLAGVVDDATAAVLVQLTRHHHAKVHWLSQHSMQPKFASHNILRSGNTEACQSQLLKDLAECSGFHQVREQGIHPQSMVNPAKAPSQLWAAHLAYKLATLQATEQELPFIGLASDLAPLRGSAVTFFIETC